MNILHGDTNKIIISLPPAKRIGWNISIQGRSALLNLAG